MTDTIQFFDLAVNATRSLLWQYNEAVRLQTLVENEQDWFNENQTQFWENWHRDVFNLMTANQFGLTVWAIILDIPITVTITPPDPENPPWGFEEYNQNFENGNFYAEDTGVISLTVEQARTVLRMRYFQITSRGCVPEINRFINYLFGPLGGGYVVDNLDMTASLVLNFSIPSKLKFIFENYDILPRPAGVGMNVTSIDPATGAAYIGSGIGINYSTD